MLKSSQHRGTPFWNNHQAKKLLSKYVADNIDKTMKLKEMWQSQEEYSKFPLKFFSKSIYEVRSKQIAGPYWQVKRNKNAMKLYRVKTDRMRTEWEDYAEVEEWSRGLKVGEDND